MLSDDEKDEIREEMRIRLGALIGWAFRWAFILFLLYCSFWIGIYILAGLMS